MYNLRLMIMVSGQSHPLAEHMQTVGIAKLLAAINCCCLMMAAVVAQQLGMLGVPPSFRRYRNPIRNGSVRIFGGPATRVAFGLGQGEMFEYMMMVALVQGFEMFGELCKNKGFYR